MSGIQLYAENIAANLFIPSQTQGFSFSTAISQYQIINLFIPTSLVFSQNTLEFINVNDAGYRFRQLTSSTATLGNLILETFTMGAIPGSPLLTYNENGPLVFSLTGSNAFQLKNNTNVTPLEFYNSTGTNYVGFQAGTLSTNTLWTLPTTDSTGTQSLISNGSGTLSWKSFVPIAGGTMTGPLILNADPTNPLGAVTKEYADAISQGLTFKNSCYAATTANLNAIYLNGVAGVGATLTNNSSLAAFSIDSVSPPLNSRILVKNQSTSFQNGIYTLTTVGSGSVSWVLTRSTDYNSPSEIAPGDFILIDNGTVNINTAWVETATINTIGTDAISFSKFGNPGTVINVSGTIGQIDVVNGTSTPVISIDPGYLGQNSIVTVGTVTTGIWNAGIIPVLYGGTGSSTASGALSNLGAAPSNARYIIQTSSASLINAQVLASLTTGIVKNTTTTGVLSIATAGVDYYSPGHPTTLIDDFNLNGTPINSYGNVGVGTLALFSLVLNSSTNTLNTAIGSEALYAFTTGVDNTAVGQSSLFSFVSGSDNTAVGLGSGYYMTSGNQNSIFGSNALPNITSGSSRNSVFGYNAAQNQSIYNNCCFFGARADASTNNLTNATAIGADAVVGASNCIVLGNGCNVGIGTSSPTTAKVVISGGVQNIVGEESALRVISALSNVKIELQSTAAGGKLYELRSSSTGAFDITDRTGSATRFIITTAGNIGIGGSLAPNAALQLGNVLANRRIVLYETANNDHQYYGLGINSGTFRYQVDSTTSDHVWYAGTSSTTSNEIMRLKGTGTGLNFTTSQVASSLLINNTNASSYANDIFFQNNGAFATAFGFNNSTNEAYAWSYGTAAFKIGTAATERFRITNAGDALFQQTIYGRRASGCLYMQGNAVATTLTANTWTKIAGTTTSISLNQFSMPVSNRFQYTSTVLSPILTSVTASITCNFSAGNASTTRSFAIFKNGVQVTPSVMAEDAASGANLTFSTTTLISMVTNDYIEVFIQSSNNTNVTVSNLILNVTTT